MPEHFNLRFVRMDIRVVTFYLAENRIDP